MFITYSKDSRQTEITLTADVYDLIAYPGLTDVIKDGFYDIGYMTPGVGLLSLEEYHSQPVDSYRPIILVNPARSVIFLIRRHNTSQTLSSSQTSINMYFK